MQVRCGDCRRATRIADAGATACPLCGAPWPPARKIWDPGASDDERDRTAENFAHLWKIDQASANSVLLGIMTLEDAVSVREDGPAPGAARSLPLERRPAPAPTGSAGEAGSTPAPLAASETDSIDPAFLPAIQAGRLTERQAKERGERAAYASRLAVKYGLAMRDAYLVADNATSLQSAVERRDRRRADVLSPASASRGRSARLLVGACVVLVAALAAWTAISRLTGLDTAAPPGITRGAGVHRPQPSDPETPAAAEVEVRTDLRGVVTEIAGPTPEAVLAAFCERSRGRDVEPVRVIHAGDACTGVYRQGVEHLAIPIRKDVATGRWRTGNGVNPIAVTPFAAAP